MIDQFERSVRELDLINRFHLSYLLYLPRNDTDLESKIRGSY